MKSPNPIRASILLPVSLILLNALIGVHRWMPDPGVFTLLAPTLETVVVLFILLASSTLGRRDARWVHWPLSALVMVLVLFGIGEGFYQTIFRKGFVPWTDLGFLPALLNMVTNSNAFDSGVLVLLPVALLAAIVTISIYFLLRWTDALIRSTGWYSKAAVGVLFLALALPLVLSGYRVPLMIRAGRQVRPPEWSPAAVPEVIVAAAEEDEEAGPDYYFDALQDRDIHLLIVESYGRTLLTNDSHRPLIEPVYDKLERELRDSGFSIYSGFLKSPAFGGRSWLADSTLLTGTFIDSQHTYDEMIKTTSTNLTHLLGEAGYHRILAAPGTYEADETWRSFYEFDDYLFRYDFGYEGPFVSFGAMPDQYLLYRTHQRAAGVEGPLFVNYILVSSHVPFDQLPQYVPDWDLLGDGSIFNEIDLRHFDNNWLSGGEYPEGYVASIEYTLTSATAFITTIVEDPSLFIIVGDHQPRVPISESTSTFSVPFHVISRDEGLVSGFADYGLTPGLQPDQSLPHAGMEQFLPMLLTVAHGLEGPDNSVPEEVQLENMD